MRFIGTVLGVVLILFSSGAPVEGQAPPPPQSREDTIIDNSQLILREIMEIPVKSIPLGLFQKAEGVAFFPGMMKGGFIVGVQRGRGILVIKDKNGTWENPRFATLTGGSIGFQAGVQSADVILVFCTRRSVEAALSGRFTIGADATVAAGPIGRQTSAATDLRLTSEIYSYSRSRGVFLGAAIDGSVLDLDNDSSLAYYRNGIPAPAQKLLQLIISYASPPVQGAPPVQPVPPTLPVQQNVMPEPIPSF